MPLQNYILIKMNNRKKSDRKAIRLKEYDYSSPGYYFVTICTKDRKCLFGEITDQGMGFNDAGSMVKKVWDELPIFYPNITRDVFVVMPNHIHGIIIIDSFKNAGAGPRACPEHPGAIDGQPQGVAPTNQDLSLPDIVHRFKSMTTNQYIKNVKQNDWKPFNKKLWQRNYYEHVIRNDIDLEETREYILNNPKKWDLDKNNPINWETQRKVNNV